MLRYFELYGLKPGFHPGAAELREAYLKIQREWHPDFFVSDPDKYVEALEKTSLNNQAYKALQNLNSIVDYVLREFDMLQEGEKNLLSPEFLAEMLDLNDIIAEAAMGDEKARTSAENVLGALEVENRGALEAATRHLETLDTWTVENLAPLKDLYQRQRYLARLRKNLS